MKTIILLLFTTVCFSQHVQVLAGAELQYNALYRTDLKDRYGSAEIVHSVYFNLIYRF